MRTPNFFVAGPPKTGSTSLHFYLRQHPQVYMNPIKEPTFFATEDLRSRADYLATVERERPALRKYLDGPQIEPAQYWVTEWDDYVKLFRNARDHIAVGEASVSYFWMPTAAAAIRLRLPAARLIFILRDPVERVFSWYLMTLRREPGLTFRGWLQRTMNGGEDRGPAVDGGRYATHLQRFFDNFPRHQIRIYLYEDLQLESAAVIRDLFSFLGVNWDHPVDLSRRHNETLVPRFPLLDRLRTRILGQRSLISWLPAPARPPLRNLYQRGKGAFTLKAEDRRMVIDYYREEILRTAHLIGRDLSTWLH